MRKSLKALGVLLAIALAWIALIASGWLPRPTARQRAAQAALAPEPANVKGERNAFAALYLHPYDVPADQIEALAKADVAAFAVWHEKPGPKEPWVSTLEGKFTKLTPAPLSAKELCALWEADCLDRVRRDPEATRATLARLARHLEIAESIDHYDHYRYGFEPSWDAPFGMAGSFSLPLVAAALDYADGKRDAAFARVCRNARAWRTLRAHTDMLIVDMIGVAVLSGESRLYAEMLAEQPSGFAPPCPEVFAPLADAEIDQCATFRFEYRSSQNTLRSTLFGTGGAVADGQDRFTAGVLNLLVNRDHVDAMAAGMFGPYCGDEHRARAAKRSGAALELDPGCRGTDWALDPFGCVVFGAMLPQFDGYYLRVLDLDARLKLLQSAIWLRAQPVGTDLSAAFAKRPAELVSAEQDTSIDVAAGVLRMKPLDKSRGEIWEIRFAPRGAPPAS